jgi:membrane protease subunit HflK
VFFYIIGRGTMSDDKNPWERKQDGPPDLLNLLKKTFGKKGGGDGGGDGGGAFVMPSFWLWAVIAFIVIIYLLSGIYIVNQAQQAVVLKFGQYAETVGPGPHWLLPLVETDQKVDIQQIRNFQYQSDMLTMDENIVNVSFAVQFRIDNPRDYLFNVVNPGATLQQATASALRQVVGHMKLDPILTTGRGQLRDRVATQLNETIKAYKMGIVINDVRLLQTKPPEAVTAAFDDAIKAREDGVSSVNKGEAYASKVTSEVKGQIAKLDQTAQAYKQEVVLQAQGDVARYDALLKPYLASPAVTRERLYLDTVQDVLSHTNNVIVDSGAHNVLYLPLDQMIKSHLAANLSKLPTPAQNTGVPTGVSQDDINKAKTQIENVIQRGLYGKPRSNYSTTSATAGGYRS